MKPATKQYKICISETNYIAYYVEAQSPEEAQQIWSDNGYESGYTKVEDSDFTIIGIEEVTQ